MRRLLIAASAMFALAAIELKPKTLEAYQRYVALTEQRIQGERHGQAPFLWIDRLPADRRADALAKLDRGEIVVSELETRDNGRDIDVDDGLIHHWVGTVLIPGASVDEVLDYVRRYDRYAELFAPMIVRSRVIAQDGTTYTVAMRTSVKKVITVVMDADYVIDYERISPTRVFASNVATHLHQVHDAGEPGERREPGDDADGYLWRFQMWCSFDQRDAGTYEQCESISLTRGVPWVFAWIVKPFVTGIPRETLAFTLGKVRSGVGAGRP
jgi:hypothetical protein